MYKLFFVVFFSIAIILEQKGVYCSLTESARASSDLKWISKESKNMKGNSVKSEAWIPSDFWKTRTFFYTLKSIDDKNKKKKIKDALQVIQDFTCLYFKEMDRPNDQPQYLNFIIKDKCESFVSPHGGFQDIVLSEHCILLRGKIIHEVMHALGRYHEHQRPDRDDYIRVSPNNIKKGNKENIQIIEDADTQKIPYDYLSLMHYSPKEFAKPETFTFTSILIDDEVRTGQAYRMTMYDALHINMRFCPELMVRLVGGKTINEGRIEVFWNGQWGSVCGGKSFDVKDAKVICKYLGFPGVQEVFTNSNSKFGQGYEPAWFKNMECKGDEPTPFHCSNPSANEIMKRKCPSEKYAGVICKKNIRLYIKGNKLSQKRGIVEGYNANTWGRVTCSPNFGMNEAKVICRQFGKKAQRIFRKYHPKRVEGKFTMYRQLECTGKEDNINQCKYAGLHNIKCETHDDFGVICK